MTAPSNLRIASDLLSASVAVLGAEVQDLSDAQGRLLQWTGDPAVWNGRAPILFPIVGALVDGRYRHRGRTYELQRHGFARRSTFTVVEHTSDRAHLRLVADDASRAVYPFAFRLDVEHAIAGATYTLAATVTNDGDEPMPASLGFHPAFAWPLPYGRPRGAHAVTFAHAEPEPIRRLDAAGLLLPRGEPSPVVGRVLRLADADFDADAIIFDDIVSREVSYGADDGPRLVVRFDGMPMLGIWSKPGAAPFVCIEPWHGIADPEGFDGEFADKPGSVVLAPGASRRFAMTVERVD
jgi:galactose mutarotase-like enzyme